MKGRWILPSAMVMLLRFSLPAHASLIDREGALLPSSDLNITSLQEAILAARNPFGGSGIDASGPVDWNTAQPRFAATNGANSLGLSHGRLPTTMEGPYGSEPDGSIPAGENI